MTAALSTLTRGPRWAGRYVRDRAEVRRIRHEAIAAVHPSGDAELTSAISRFGRRSGDPAVRAWVDKLEARRRKLLQSHEPVELLNIDGTSTWTTAAEVCERTSRDRMNCSFLLELVIASRAATCVELGTSIGISGSYIAAGLDVLGSGGRLVTLDRQANVSAIARRDLEDLGLRNADVVVCVFEHELERIGNENQPIDFLFLDGNHHEEPTMLYFGLALPFLEPGAIVVFDDIGWNDGMRRAWRRIQEHPSVRTAVKVGSIGVTRIVR